MDNKWFYDMHIQRALRMRDFSLVGFEELEWAHAAFLATVEDPDHIEAAVSSNALSTMPAGICRMIGAENGFEWVILAEPDEIEIYREHNFPILDKSVSPVLGDGTTAPKIDKTNIGFLTAAQRHYLAHGFGMMKIVEECDSQLLFHPGSAKTGKVVKVVSALTLGRDSIEDDEMPSWGWQTAYISHRNRVDAKALDGIAEYDRLVGICQRVAECYKIWDSVLKNHYVTQGVEAIGFEEANADAIAELADMFGITANIEALYAGVPVEDILA